MAQDPLIIINIDPAGDPVHNHEHIIRGLGILRAMEYIPGIDSPKKRDRETLEHIAVTRYLECLIHHGYIIAYSTIPNSTYTPFRSVKAKGKMMGVSKGFPDIASILYVEQETDLIKTALAIAQGGAMAKVAGVSFTDFNTTIAAISSAFSSGSDAGTSYKVFLQNLVPKSTRAATAMEEIGFSAFDAQGKMKSMRDIAENLQESIAGMSDEQRNATLTTIFGTDAMRAAAMIAETGAEGYDKLAASIAKTDAAAQSATRLDNFWGSLEKLKGTIDVIATSLGSYSMRKNKSQMFYDGTGPEIRASYNPEVSGVHMMTK